MRARIVHIGFLSIIFALFGNLTYAQNGKLGRNDTIMVNAIVWDGDTIPAKTLDWVWVTGQLTAEQSRRKAEWTRLRNAVYVTYPYAKRAGVIINDINAK